MNSALNYVDVYTSCQLSNISLIKDKLYDIKIEVALVQQWERGNGGSLQTDVPCNPPPPLLTEGVTAKMAAWAPGPQGLTLCKLPDTISLNLASKLIFRPWHNSSSSPVLLTTSLSVSVFQCFYFPQSGPWGGWSGVPHLSNSCKTGFWGRVFHWAWMSGAPPYRFIMLATMDGAFLGLSRVVLPLVWTLDA